jgi:GTP-binding protein
MDILSAEYVKSSPGYKDCPPADKAEFAFIGRSNVGKSSLINMLTGKKNLAKTSATPGKTQLINHFKVVSTNQKGKKEQWYLVDLPGYGYAKVSQRSRNNWDNMIGSYIRKRENLMLLLVLIDSRHEPQEADIEFINKLGEWKIPFAIVFTKIDKNRKTVTEKNVEAFAVALSVYWEELPPYFLTSAVERTGRDELLGHISSQIPLFAAS